MRRKFKFTYEIKLKWLHEYITEKRVGLKIYKSLNNDIVNLYYYTKK